MSLDWSDVTARFGDLPRQATAFDVTVSPAVVDRCLAFARILVDANASRNLTRLASPEGLAVGMFLDSLLFLRALTRLRPSTNLVDVGCGAGFPAVPLAIARPDVHVTAVDSRKMKVDFIAEAAAELGLTNLEARHSRAEDLPEDGFDAATARALGDLPVSLGWTLPLVKPGGPVVIARGAGDLDEALRLSRKQHKHVRFDTWRYRLPGYDNDFAQVVAHRSA